MTVLTHKIDDKYIFIHNCRVLSVRASNRYSAQKKISNQLRRNN